ncbi:hypothetical protein C8F04DRAFT_1242302 [Mycena alexandri]|uniref:cAMP-independent regulatory protein pac2 n=1 Tax=Mycena alexandri TaxID=1745969 RepID=A0AAD6WP72_9AGAR|nr:hypothetical protein C8F04DRAFT_1242302 [Mycena alexandri]
MPPVPFPQHWQPPAQQPTCTNLRIRSVDDAHKIFYAVRCNILRMVSRRLDSDERAALRTGSVYAWEERSPNTEITGIGIERFTEGRRWSASRVRDEFLFYYERWVPDPNQADASDPPVGWEQLIKQTYSVWIETERGRRKWHLTAYYTQTTVDRLGTVDDIPDVRRLEVPQGLFTSTRIGKRKNTDTDPSQSSVARIYAAFPAPIAPRPERPGESDSGAARVSSPSVRMYEPYSRPQSRTRPPPSPAPYHGAGEVHPEPSTSRLPSLQFSYPSPADSFSMPPPAPRHYPRSESVMREHSPAPTQPYSDDTLDRVRRPPVQYSRPTEPPPPDWITSPMAPYAPRQSSPRSDYASSSSSSSSYASSPTAPLYPLYSSDSAIHNDSRSSRTDRRSLPRMSIPIGPSPVVLISSPSDPDRRGDIGPSGSRSASSRDLAPLNSLRLHPYRRDPTDDRALRLLEIGSRTSP